MSFGTSGERTPLRSLQNEMLQHSPSISNTKTQSMVNVDVGKTAKENVALCDDQPNLSPTSSPQKSAYARATEKVYQLGDVTFKSFNCTGAEVEVLSSLLCPEESVILPLEQAINNTHGTEEEDTVYSDSMIAHSCDEHIEHPYFNTCIKDVTTVESDAGESQCPEFAELDNVHATQNNCREKDVTWKSYVCDGGEEEVSDEVRKTDDTIPLPQSGDSEGPHEQTLDLSHYSDGSANCNYEKEKTDHLYCIRESVVVPVTTVSEILHTTALLNEETDYSQCKSAIENGQSVVNADPPVVIATPCLNVDLDDKSGYSQKCDAKQELECEISAQGLLHHSSDGGDLKTSTAATTAAERQATLSDTQVHPSKPPCHSSVTKDSGLDLYFNAPALSLAAERPQAENLPDDLKTLSEYPTVASAWQFGFLNLLADQVVCDDSAVVGDKSLVAPGNVDNSELWKEHLDSPMPRPLLNSTTLLRISQSFTPTEATEDVQPCAVLQPEANKPVLDAPLITEGPLQQQLRQMAEFLLLASGKVGPTTISAPTVPPAQAKCHNACLGTTPVKLVNHSLNTSGQFERKRDFTVADQCTLTDPLLWNVSPGSLECLSRQELEQRLLSSMIMVEALVQQLTAARARGCTPPGPSPSDLREKLVQTEHTELSQTTMHRDLYLEALKRIRELETDDSSLQNLVHYMQNMKITMTSLAGDTDAALCKVTQIKEAVEVDHQSLGSHYGQMKTLLERSREILMRTTQKVKDSFQQREDMRSQMEEAFTAKEAAFSVMDQLRKRCSTEICELEKCVGSQQELLSALNKTYPEQAALNKAYSETLNSASVLLSKTTEEQSSLTKELYTVRGLLQRSTPILLKLNEKAAAALRDRDEHIAARDQALQEKEQIEEELNQANLNLQSAEQQISDLNLQVTILTSEMGVLRQKLTESEDERAQLDRKATELSATVSSTLASYTFLEQALASETTRLQLSWKDKQQANDRAEELEVSLGHSKQCVSELSEALAHREEQLSQQQTLSESQTIEIQQLQDVCTQLSGVHEMNEFLQMENEVAREQMAESERLLSATLQSLRERNIQCEVLNLEIGELKNENKKMQEELGSLRTKFTANQAEHREKLAQAVTEITLLHHSLRGLTNELQASLKEEKQNDELQPPHNMKRCHPSSSFVDNIMLALQSDKKEEQCDRGEEQSEPEAPKPQFSKTSAFTTVTPKKASTAAEVESDEELCDVAKLLAGLDSTVTELSDTLTLVQRHKGAQLEDMHNTICRLQREQEAANDTHQTEVSQLKHQLSRLNALVEKGNLALQQKAQDDKTMSMLVADITEVQEMLNKHKADNKELQKEVVALRRSLHDSRVESDVLRDELKKTSGQSAAPAHFMEDKISLLKEVERLKMSLQEEQQAKVKIIERAKRHQVVYQTNQHKCEMELQMLNNMINKIRETLLSLPGVVKNCEQIQQLIDYIG